MKRITIILALLHFSLLTFPSSAAVPLRWTVETSRLQPVVFDAVRGETLALEASFQSYGTPVSTSNMTAFLCWQTNGMANAWWITNAVTSATRARVLFTPEMDPGASVVHAFLGLSDSTNQLPTTSYQLPSISYRAAFTLRFRPGPGASPNAISYPPPVLDLAHTAVINEPWPTRDDFAATTTVMRAELKSYVDGEIAGSGLVTPQGVTNIVDAKIADIPKEGVSTNAVTEIVSNSFPIVTNAYTKAETDTEIQNATNGLLRASDYHGDYITDGKNTIKANRDVIEYSRYVITNGVKVLLYKHEPPSFGYAAEYRSADYDGVTKGVVFYNDSIEDGICSPILTPEYWPPYGAYYTCFPGETHTIMGITVTISDGMYAEPPYITVDKLATTNDLAQKQDALPYATNAIPASVIDAPPWASSSALASVSATADQALSYSAGVYNYMTANTNAWFAGTNYVFGADATNKTHFAFESGMDLASMPCSMALWELREGSRQNVWDQRDWVAWYWNFKSSQMRADFAVSNAAIRAEIASTNNHAWARHYAATGRQNPDPTTTYVDTPRICLSPGMNWETVAEVGGCGYWTIVGNGAVIGGSGTNAVLSIRDFEGNEVMTVTKGEHRLAWLASEDFTGQMHDANGWVCFDMMADMQPVGYYSTTLESGDFTVETDAGCPAQYTWENLGNGTWRIHFLLKPGIVSSSCFAKFQVEVEAQTEVRYTAGVAVQGGLIYNGVKIAPVIPSGASAGSTVTWKVVQ